MCESIGIEPAAAVVEPVVGGDAPEAPSHTRGVCVFVSSSSSSFVVVVVGGGGRVARRASRAARPHEEQRRAGAGCSELQQRGPACRGCVLARRVSRRVRPVRTPHGADPAKHRGGGTSPASPARRGAEVRRLRGTNNQLCFSVGMKTLRELTQTAKKILKRPRDTRCTHAGAELPQGG